MRTKALVCAAAMAVACLAQTQAQVYSVNVAGYVTLSLTNGYNMIANPLDFDGTGTNNSIYTSLSTNCPNGTVATVFWAPTAAFSNCTYLTSTKKWTGPTNAAGFALNPGKGLFVRVIAAGVVTTNITFVGNVLQGPLTNKFQVTGNQILSSMVPQGGALGPVGPLGITPANADKVSQWNTPAQKYFNGNTYLTSGTPHWTLGEPQVSVGEAFFIQTHALTKWNRNFTVQ